MKQIEDRACEEGCYPPMMDKNAWNLFMGYSKIDIAQIEKDAIRILKEYGYDVKNVKSIINEDNV